MLRGDRASEEQAIARRCSGVSAVTRDEDRRTRRSDRRRAVVVVDPRPLFADAIATSFDPGDWRVGVVPPSAVAALPIRSNIAVVALSTPGCADLVGLLTARNNRVIVYGSDDGRTFFDAVEAGAVGFVSDQADAGDFRRAAAALRDGAVLAFPEHTRRRLLERTWSEDEGAAGLDRLTAREREVLDGLVGGLRPAEIAARDFVSVTTVRNQVQAVLTKLNVHSQLEAVATAHRHGWVLDSA